MKKNLCVVGLGYIGLPFALLLAQKKFNVLGYDIDNEKIKNLKSGRYFFEENELYKLYKKIYKNKNIKFLNKILPSDIYLLCLPTPLSKNKKCDLSFIKKALNQLFKVLKKKDTIILESTVGIGDTEKIKKYIEFKRKDLKNKINLCFVPEKAIPGKTLFEMKNNDRFIGCDKKIFHNVAKIYKSFCNKKVQNCTIKEAEASKLIENAFRDNQIAFSNFIAKNLENKKISFKKIMKICNKHPRVNLLNPSIGVGGHCIPLDPYFLNFKKIYNIDLIKNSRILNDNRTIEISKKILRFLKKNKRTKVCLWGLGYKPGTIDTRESPAIRIIKFLKNKKQNFYVSDPNYKKIKLKGYRVIDPKRAIKLNIVHIILNLSETYVKSKLSKSKYIYAEDV